MNDTCPACGAKIKTSVFGTPNVRISPEMVAIINEYHSAKADERCNSCGDELYRKYDAILRKERTDLIEKIQAAVRSIPIVSLQSPLGWEYSVRGLVTAQSTTGTGVFSEFTSAFTDMFGAQSKVYNQKLKAGEDMCKAILRKEALDLRANAVLAADIDYAEVGGEKGMLMVCMTGTAVLMRNPEILGADVVVAFNQLNECAPRLDHLNQYRSQPLW